MLTIEQSKASESLWVKNSNGEATIVQLVAGAGSGKTTTLIQTLETGIHNGYDSSQICLITFTRKAAAEMLERMKARNLQAGYVGTMHALGWQIIKSMHGFNKKILLHKENILYDIIRTDFKQYSHIPVDVVLRGRIFNEDEQNRLHYTYTLYKSNNNLIDLDDLIFEATRILRKNPEKFPYSCVLVDEFQDTSPDQLDFIKSMTFKKLFVVGDDWQSIYKFRGADVGIALNFNKTFSGVQRLFLTDNFRSQRNIVTLGNKAIKLSKNYIRKKLRAHQQKTSRPICHIARQNEDISLIWRLYLEKYFYKSKYKPLTVLVRTNHIRKIVESIIPENVSVMTIHSSKGMEFENVLIFGIADHVFPHRWNDYNEEVRLLYVAITRAKKNLEFLSWETDTKYSSFMPFLVKHCKLNYLN
ncbi:MAG: UvrD-helicase domain-containing protein [Spirochaetia bacterium]|nr:UvrD-helicase domain-containing protein [Spirochaetia bacterium]